VEVLVSYHPYCDDCLPCESNNFGKVVSAVHGWMEASTCLEPLGRVPAIVHLLPSHLCLSLGHLLDCHWCCGWTEWGLS